MKSIISYLDELKEIAGSDYAAAKMLEISKVSVSQIRKRGSMSDETALKLAALIKADEDKILLAAAVSRSEGAARTAWERISKKAGAAAAIFLLIAGGISPRECEANGGETLQFIHYAKLWRLASWRL